MSDEKPVVFRITAIKYLGVNYDVSRKLFESDILSKFKLPARGWPCANAHLNPDTGTEFLNGWERETCEICGRARDR